MSRPDRLAHGGVTTTEDEGPAMNVNEDTIREALVDLLGRHHIGPDTGDLLDFVSGAQVLGALTGEFSSRCIK